MRLCRGGSALRTGRAGRMIWMEIILHKMMIIGEREGDLFSGDGICIETEDII